VRGERRLYDVVVLGAGPGGEAAATALARAGKRLALVERELIGGECTNWACVPTKTLLRPAEVLGETRRTAGVADPAFAWRDVAAYRDYMVRDHDDAAAVERYEQRGVSVFKGAGRLAGPGRVEVDGQLLESEHVVVATGSEPIVPPIDGLREAGYWTNREASSLQDVPASAIVIGAGPAGVELAQMLARFGSRVTVVDIFDRPLRREEPRVGELVEAALAEDGVEVLLGHKATSAQVDSDERVLRFENGREERGEVLIVAGGRRPRVEGIGLESVGVEPAPRGIAIDEHCRAAEGVWAIGDVTGVAMFTHLAKYQGRVVAANILGEQARADYRAVPRVVFCDPEVAAVGLTEAQASEQGMEVATATIELPGAISRPYTYEQRPRGTLGIVADLRRNVLAGAWAVAPLAGEWIHHAVLAIRAQIPLDVLRDTIPQFPTYSEAYLAALRELPR
jgi:pyruvate/2-oxoglutarate dehydrogenase complex dihydrolipoamide dehydrogenase (E3) component